jgi:threonine dehydratase
MGACPACKVILRRTFTKRQYGGKNVRIPTLSGVQESAKAVASVVPRTALIPLKIHGVQVFAKAESLQPIGAFKLRGAWWRLSSLSEAERDRGVVAYSSGNHAQGIAWAAKRLNINATIVMPSDAPEAKLARTRAFGVNLLLYNRRTEDRDAIARSLAEERGATLVPPFADPWVIEGQGSAAIEAIAQMAEMGFAPPDAMVTCCGGGGLSAGFALACPDAALTIVEPQGWDDVTRSLALGHIVAVPDDAPPTACDALMTKAPAPITFDILKAQGATGVAVSPDEVAAAQRFAFAELRLVLEPGGAVALAAVLSGKVRLGERTLITLSGGNVDAAAFAKVIAP